MTAIGILINCLDAPWSIDGSVRISLAYPPISNLHLREEHGSLCYGECGRLSAVCQNRRVDQSG